MIKKTKQAFDDGARQALEFVRENDGKTVVKHVLSHDAHPVLQFAKYGICGVMAVIIHLSTVYILGLTVLPAIGEDLSIELKKHNGTINNTIGFFVSGVVVYLLNRKFVFKPGRHHAALEVFLFFAVAGVALVSGNVILRWIFDNVETNKYVEHIANLGFVFTSALVNFIARKFLVFKG